MGNILEKSKERLKVISRIRREGPTYSIPKFVIRIEWFKYNIGLEIKTDHGPETDPWKVNTWKGIFWVGGERMHWLETAG